MTYRKGGRVPVTLKLDTDQSDCRTDKSIPAGMNPINAMAKLKVAKSNSGGASAAHSQWICGNDRIAAATVAIVKIATNTFVSRTSSL